MLTAITEFLALVPTFVWWVTGAIVAAVLAITIVRAAVRAARNAWRTAEKRPTLEDILTVVAAAIATSVSASGMWKFAGDVLHLDGPFRVALFAFIELAVVVSALRARRSMRENYSAGIDGAAVWALACLTAVLSTLDSRSFGEAVFRLSAPLVAAWLWDRGMAIERQKLTGLKRIHWRITPERVLVRMGLAESSDRTASDVDAHRRLTRLAKAAKKARTLELAGARNRKQQRALAALDRAVEKAVEHSGLSSSQDRQRQMLDQIGAVFAAGDLRHLPAIAPWSTLTHPLTSPEVPGTRPGTADLTELVVDAADVPEVPADLPAATLPLGPVPDELYPLAAERYAPEIADGKIPGIKRIKDDLNVGQPKAVRVQSYLSDLARTRAQVPAATFREPGSVNGSATVHADAITTKEVS